MSNSITIGHSGTLNLHSLQCWPLLIVMYCAFADIMRPLLSCLLDFVYIPKLHCHSHILPLWLCH